MLRSPITVIAVVAVSAVIASGCQQQGTALEAISSPQTSVSSRALQSQVVEAASERAVIQSTIDTLQDFGFDITESSISSGIVSGAKKQSSGSFYGLYADVRVTVTVLPKVDNEWVVRAGFQKIIPSHDPRLYRSEPIANQTIYRDFFDKLKQSLFLSKNEA